MKYKILFLSIFILFSCNNDNEKLDAIIKEYQNHEGYNYEDYPLGNFSEEYFKAEKEFAESLLLKLDDIDITNLDENDNNLASAKSNYMSAFDLIENNFESYESFFKESDRDLIFEIGSAVSNHKIFKDLGITALKFYSKTYDFMDNYPLESVYYRLALIYLSKRDLKSSSENLAKALVNNPKFQNALDFKKKHKL